MMNKAAIKVLFCGKQFDQGFKLTKKALQNFPNIVTTQCSLQDLPNEIKDADVVVPLMAKITPQLIDSAKNLKLINQLGVGLEGVDIDYATKSKIWVAHNESEASGNAQSCAELAIFHALFILRDYKEMHNSVIAGKIGFPVGKTLYKSNCMVFGYGGLGRQLTHRLKSFDANIKVLDKNTIDPSHQIEGVTYHSIEEFPTVAQSSDIVFLTCTQNPSTIGMVNKDFIQMMKKGSALINIARGGLLVYEDVLEALNSGHLGGVGIDVYKTEPFPPEEPFLHHPKVVATPHVAGVTEVSYQNMARLIAGNIQKLINGEELYGTVNRI